jgi:protein-tyrosine phosphatase
MAEAVLRARIAAAGLAEHVIVESAGTGSWHVGQPADPRARTVLAAAGYDANTHIARQFTLTSFAEYDLILALDRDNLTALNRIAPDAQSAAKLQLLRAYDVQALAADELDVPDPYYGGAAGFELVLHQVERAVDGLMTTLQDELST